MQRSWGSGVRQRCPWLSCYYPAMVLCYRRGDRYLGGQVAIFATPGWVASLLYVSMFSSVR